MCVVWCMCVSGVWLVVAAVAIWEKNSVILRWQRGKFLFLICISSVNRSAQINFRYCSCISIVWHGSQTTCSSYPHFLLLFKSCIQIQVSVFFLAEELPLMWFDSLPTPFLPPFLFFPFKHKSTGSDFAKSLLIWRSFSLASMGKDIIPGHRTV